MLLGQTLQLVHWLSAHSLANSRDLRLLTMVTGVLLSLLTGKTDLVVRGVYGVWCRQDAVHCPTPY